MTTSAPAHNKYFFRYISTLGAQNLHHYKYSGSDASFFYNYISNPYIYPFCLKYIPLWVAPNLITLCGLFCTLITYAIMSYYCPAFEGEAPIWAYVLNAACLFSYQTLDALDGKQARRTGTSSPLGLLFDHGCDAINTTVSCLTLICSLQLGATWMTFSMWGGSVIVFYAATWEEYYTGSLSLPLINGPNEGILITIFFHFLTAYRGPSFWLEQNPTLGINNNTIVYCISVTTFVVTVACNIKNVVQSILRKKDPKFSLPVALTRMTNLIIIVGAALVWVLFSPSHIFERHPQLVIWGLAFVFCKLVTQLMVAHLCEEEYHPFGKTLSVIYFIILHASYSIIKGMRLDEEYTGYKVDEDFVLYEFFAIAFATYTHLVAYLGWEVTTILKIKCFKIPYLGEGEGRGRGSGGGGGGGRGDKKMD